MCFHKWGISQSGWFIMEHPKMDGGTPILGNPHILMTYSLLQWPIPISKAQ